MDVSTLYEVYRQYPNVITDSRVIEKDCLFFALKGERFDGNAFAAEALKKGAAYVVVDKPEVVKGERYLLVEDSLQMLQELARHHRRTFSIPIIGITGSNGKTTTKELVSAVMGSHYKVYFTQGNYNNHIGVPLTLLAMPTDIEAGIIEMGANHQGEIDFLCRIAEPSHGIITNIGKAHLEGFGGIEGVKKGKSELYRYLEEKQGMAFINKDSEVLVELAEPLKRKVFYRSSQQPSSLVADMEIKLLSSEPFISVAFLDRQKQVLVQADTQLYGLYNFENIKTAIALGKYFKVPAEKIKQAVEAYIPENNRSQIIKNKDNTFYLDAYNANPTSMAAAISAFSKVEGSAKIAILGDMLELGADSLKEHQAIADHAEAQHFERIIFVGKEFEAIAKQRGILHFANVQELKSWFEASAIQNRVIFIKGSRGMRLEMLIK
jgi:UDP-N-acetylmuramoyl-tripeptide--D-alanyl-D-alanine ligase